MPLLHTEQWEWWMMRSGRRCVSSHCPHHPLTTLRARWSRLHIAQDIDELTVVPEPDMYFLFQSLWPLSPVGSHTSDENPESPNC